MKIEIRNRYTDAVIFYYECEDNTIKITVEQAIKEKIDLRSANLSDADLSYANLSYADLSYADLSYANLSYADLSYANLSYANLSYADLSYANLSYADLSDANLRSANLSYADLSYANLSYANLSYADLSDANLLYFKSDIWRVLLMYKSEIPGLKQSIIDGKINGSQYSGECACLKGTIANVKGCKVDELPNITKSSSEPGESWFLQFKEGDNPENSQSMKMTLEWIEEFEFLLNAK